MYIQRNKEGEYFVKLATAFEHPESISQDNKVVSFEEYIFNLYSTESLMPQMNH